MPTPEKSGFTLIPVTGTVRYRANAASKQLHSSMKTSSTDRRCIALGRTRLLGRCGKTSYARRFRYLDITIVAPWAFGIGLESSYNVF